MQVWDEVDIRAGSTPRRFLLESKYARELQKDEAAESCEIASHDAESGDDGVKNAW